MKHSSHIVRLLLVLALVGAGFLGARCILVPESFGIQGDYKYGYHRADSDQEQAGRAASYQGPEKCRSCHEAQYVKWQGAEHKAVGCETCHGNWQAHNNNAKDKTGKDRSPESCLQCHEKLEARPAGFPQIEEIAKHVAAKGLEFNRGLLCVSCHNPHDPK